MTRVFYINTHNVFVTITGSTALILPELTSKIFFDQISMKIKLFSYLYAQQNAFAL